MKATYLLKQNIKALLAERRQSQHDLAQWCRKDDSWLTRVLSDRSPAEGDTQRGLPVKYLDRIADFFGVNVYQLFQPGIARAAERRKAMDRRSGAERRIRSVRKEAHEAVVSAVSKLTPDDIALLMAINSLGPKAREAIRQSLTEAQRSTRGTDAPMRAAPNTGLESGGAAGRGAPPSQGRPARRTQRARGG